MLKKSFKKVVATGLIAVAALSWGSAASAQAPGGLGIGGLGAGMIAGVAALTAVVVGVIQNNDGTGSN